MKKVAQILQEKGNAIHTIDADKTVFEGLEKMVGYNIGSIVAMKNDVFVGLMTERDYAQKVMMKGRTSRDTRIEEIMDTNPISIGLNDTIKQCMELMTNERVRYLPVLSEGHVIGIVSIGDIVRSIIDDQEQTITHLHDFISGNVR